MRVLQNFAGCLLSGLEAQLRQRGLICVARVGGVEFSRGLCKLRLCQIHNAAESHLVAGLRQLQRGVCLRQQLLRDRDALVRTLRVEHGYPHIARNRLARVAHMLCRGARAKIGLFGAR